MDKIEGASNIARLRISFNQLLMGNDSRQPNIQLMMPISKPSTITSDITVRSDAPIARIIPISRVRSITFILMVPIKPIGANQGGQKCHENQECCENVQTFGAGT